MIQVLLQVFLKNKNQKPTAKNTHKNILLTVFPTRCYTSIEATTFNFSSSSDFVVVVAVVQLHSPVRLCNPLDCSTLGFSVLHHLPEFVQTHVH